MGFGGAVTASYYYTVIIEDLVMLARNRAISGFGGVLLWCAMLVRWESVVQNLSEIQEEHLEVAYFFKTVKQALVEMFPLLEMM